MEAPAPQSSALDLARLARAELEELSFPFPAEDSFTARATLADLKETLDQTVLPELERRGVPSLIGLAGSTGVGKSALANTLAVPPTAAPPSAVGVLRPTTKAPQLIGTPDSFTLLGLHPARPAAQTVPVPAAMPGRLILDAADPFAAGNNPETAQPDVPVTVWLVVTSALRYGDATLWDLLSALAPEADDALVAVVINRTGEAAREAVERDVKDRLGLAGRAEVPVFVLPAEPGKPDRIADVSAAPLVRWLNKVLPSHTEVPADALPIRPVLGEVADRLGELGEAQALHIAAVDLLKQTTQKAVAGWADEAGEVSTPKEADERIVEAWLGHIGHGGALTGVVGPDGEVPDDVDLRERWVQALADLDRAVALVDSEQVNQIVDRAREQIAALWAGPDVPEGTERLMQDKGLAELPLPQHLQGVGAHGLWGDALTAVIEAMEAPGVLRAAAAVGAEGLATLVKAAVLGASGPRSLLTLLAPDDAENLVATAIGAMARARVKAVRQACEPYTKAVAGVVVSRSRTLLGLAEQVARIVKEGLDG
ncbi:MAG: hypothetical protein LBR27_03235 [Bifidobacteriaceae bacterium]|jgi:hypothetical protein|nr:hypothetical protein [Bifidobacteriaceae bacterium]